MKLMIIRHGDPYYVNDSLTKKGWREAEFLSEWIGGIDVKAFSGMVSETDTGGQSR